MTIVELDRFRSDELLDCDRQVDRRGHHLYWPKPDYVDRFRKFRNLGCVRARTIDALVHRAHHTHAWWPSRPGIDEVEYFIERHDVGLCRCNPRNTIQMVKANLLFLPESHELFDLPCVWADVDAEVYATFIDHLDGLRIKVGQQWIDTIVYRHENGLCSCAYFAAERLKAERAAS